MSTDIVQRVRAEFMVAAYTLSCQTRSTLNQHSLSLRTVSCAAECCFADSGILVLIRLAAKHQGYSRLLLDPKCKASQSFECCSLLEYPRHYSLQSESILLTKPFHHD